VYLAQSYRLKKKLPPPRGLRLPSLEWLQQASQQALLLSSWILAAGLLAGVVLYLVQDENRMPWNDPVVWISAVLFIWLAVVLVFQARYKPARQGRKVAYLTLATFVVLALVLALVLLVPSQHASPLSRASQPTSGAAP
jgi:peptidoglycan/LPS O-acetylase OafA/YrhL